jgi:CRISPR/Cas system CSM-associated protein Csm4 (group 5 of RAMP superfamily)
MAQYMLLKEDIVNQFINDPNRPASAALAYTLNSNLSNKVYKSNFVVNKNNLRLRKKELRKLQKYFITKYCSMLLI